MSSNPMVLPNAISVDDARTVLRSMRTAGLHRFLTDGVSTVDPDLPALTGHRQVTDAHLLTLARPHQLRLVTFDSGVLSLGDKETVELLAAL